MMGIGLIYEVTSKCNLTCGFCYNSWRNGGAHPELPDIKNLKKMLQKTILDSGAEFITFAGGEPLLYPKLFEIVAFLRKSFQNMNIGIASNGTLLDRENIDRLIDCGVTYFEIPLLAATDETYRKMTGKTLLGKVREAISYVKLKNIPLNVSLLLSKVNADEFETILDMAYALGADTISLNRFVHADLGVLKREKYELSKEQLSSLLEKADRKSRELNTHIGVTIPIENCLLPHSDFPNLYF